MHPAPSLQELRQLLELKKTPVIGILFAPPYTRVAKERVVPRLGYLDSRTGSHIHFFCAGYGGYHFADDADPIGEMRYENGVVIPWGFSQRKFAEFVDDMEKETEWKYSGEADLILVEPQLDFSDALVYDIEAMQRDGAISSASQLFEAVLQFARQHGSSSSTWQLSDREGVRAFGNAAATAIIELIPKSFQAFWKRGLHYRVRDLRRSE